MKFFMLIFLFNSQGLFWEKLETEFENETACRAALAKYEAPKGLKFDGVCVSKAHHDGDALDEGVPLGYEDEEN